MNATYTQEELFCLFARGFHFCFCLYTTLYFLFFKKEKATFSYFFALCGVMLTTSIAIGTLARFSNIKWLTVEVDSLFDLTIVPAFVVFGYTLIKQSTIWWKVFSAWIVTELPVFICITGYMSSHSENIILAGLTYIIILIIIAMIWGLTQINRYNRLLKDSYSDIDNRTLTWFKYIIGAMIGIVVAYFILGKYLKIEYSPVLQPVYFIVTEVMVFIIAYFVNKQEHVDDNIMDETDDNNNDASTSSIQADYNALQEKLKTDFEEKKLYTKVNLTIKDLAEILDINSKYVSHYLNNVLGKNFNQYINELRIEEACEMLKADNTIPYDELADEVGFTSKATFWRIFQIEHNCTPTQYTSMLNEGGDGNDCNDGDNGNNNAKIGVSLSSREKELCSLIIAGADNQQQCKAMGIQISSLRVMRSRLRKHLMLDPKEDLAYYLKQHKEFL